MSEKLRHDASASISGTIYQFYIAIEECFKLHENEKVIIEIYGDVTVSGQYQIEVKQYTDDLTDLHPNIWKTIDNWLEDDFDISFYKKLILMTTQNFSSLSSFKDWNSKNKYEKKQILDAIYEKFFKKEKQGESTKRILTSVQDTKKEIKLLDILGKFVILDSSSDDSTFYEELKSVYGKVVLPQKREDYINSLLGYILSPTVRIGNSWEITEKEFTCKVNSLVNIFRSGTIIFPSKYSEIRITEDEEQEQLDQLFIKKIDDIEYNEVKSEAISDYIQTNQTILNELKNHSINKEYYDNYEEEIKRTYDSKHRVFSRKSNSNTCIDDSKDFYESIIGVDAPTFFNFSNTPKYFRNGFVHGMANEKEKNIIWKLKVKDE